MDNYICKIATIEEMEQNWNYLIEIHPNNNAWKIYKEEAIKNMKEKNTIVYYGILNGEIICEATAYIKEEAFIGDIQNTDNLISHERAYLCGFRTNEEYQGQGYFSKLYKFLEQDLKSKVAKILRINEKEILSVEGEKRFLSRDLLFSMFIATMMIPGEILVITNYVTVCSENILNWYNTYEAMIIPFWVSTYYIFLLRNTFKQIPNELYYAAKVDGTGDFKYLLKVMVPIAMPTLITITILKMMGSWNSYVWPMMVTTKDDMRLITTGLRRAFTSEEGRTVQGLQMAGSTIVTAPLLVVFIILRKYIMRGVSRSGIKG